VQVRVINAGKHSATTCIDHPGAKLAHVMAVLHVENSAEATVLDDYEAGRFTEGSQIGVEDDGFRHGFIVLPKATIVNAVEGGRRLGIFCQHC
jgi:hypothetical protein